MTLYLPVPEEHLDQQFLALTSAVDLLTGSVSDDFAREVLGDYRHGGERHPLAASLYLLLRLLREEVQGLPEAIQEHMPDGTIRIHVGDLIGTAVSEHLVEQKIHQLQRAWLNRQQASEQPTDEP